MDFKFIFNFFIFIIVSKVSFGQVDRDYIIINDTIFLISFEDTRFIRQEGEYNPGILKNGLQDGIYYAFYDDENKDTALCAIVKNGLINGRLKRWDRDGFLISNWVYSNGVKNGKSIDYVLIDQKKGVDSLLIESYHEVYDYGELIQDTIIYFKIGKKDSLFLSHD